MVSVEEQKQLAPRGLKQSQQCGASQIA